MGARGGRVWLGNLRPGISRGDLRHGLEELGVDGSNVALFHKNGGADSSAILEVLPCARCHFAKNREAER